MAFMSAFDVAAPLHWDGQPTPGLRPAYRHLSLAKIPIALGMCTFLAKVGLHLVYTRSTPPQPMRVFQLVVTQAELNMGAFLVEVGLHPVNTRLHLTYSRPTGYFMRFRSSLHSACALSLVKFSLRLALVGLLHSLK